MGELGCAAQKWEKSSEVLLPAKHRTDCSGVNGILVDLPAVGIRQETEHSGHGFG